MYVSGTGRICCCAPMKEAVQVNVKAVQVVSGWSSHTVGSILCQFRFPNVLFKKQNKKRLIN